MFDPPTTPPTQQPQLPPEPSWILKDPGSFASIHVKLPPGTRVNCESDAVVSFSDGIQVKGVLAGGLLGGLARFFFTRESFFNTAVENTGRSVADVMMAPSDPGGIVLHRLSGSNDDELFLTSGAYIASDSNVKVVSAVQSGLSNSLLSGTGFFLLKATGRGYLACGAYGAVHKYILKPGERRAVDNGHVLAWSSSMKYSVGLASRRGVVNSVTSGEGLMCYFDGPGIVYLQSHKPSVYGGSRSMSSRDQQPMKCISILIALLFIFIVVSSTLLDLQVVQMSPEEWENNYRFAAGGDHRQERKKPTQRPNSSPSYDPFGNYRGQQEF